MNDQTRLLRGDFPAIRSRLAEVAAEGFSPSFSESPSTILLDSSEKTVLETIDGLVVRIGKTTRAVNELSRERQVLAALKGQITLRIPEIVFMSKDGSIDAYPLIPGIKLTQEFFASLLPSQQKRIGDQLGEFMAQVHTVLDPDFGHKVGIPEPKWPLSPILISERLREVPLSLGARRILRRVLESWMATPKNGGPKRILHNDLGGHNFAVTPKSGELVGIYDFSDLGIADVHQEFQHLPAYGMDLVEQAAKSYLSIQKAQGFLDRREILWRHAWNVLSFVAHSHDPALAVNPVIKEQRQQWLEQLVSNYLDLI